MKKFKSVESGELEWQTVTPTEKHDWINQRDGLFDTLLPLAPDSKFNLSCRSFFTANSNGAKTQRDSWSYNSSAKTVEKVARESIDFYNATREAVASGKAGGPISIPAS